MLFLFLAIISSSLVSLLMRLGEGKVKNTMVLFLSNYAVCCITSLILMDGQTVLPRGDGAAYTIGLGLLGGILFLLSFALLRMNIRKNGVVLSSVFMKLGVMVPLLLAVAVFREIPSAAQIIGFLFAFTAVFVLNWAPGSKSTISAGMLWLLLLLLVGGLADSFVNIYDKTGAAQWKEQFLFYIFLAAGILCLITALIRREKVSIWDPLFGILIGVPNYFSSRFLMQALGTVPAIVAYPVYNVGAIVLVSLAGTVFFQEKLDRRKCVGIGMILLALILLNI